MHEEVELAKKGVNVTFSQLLLDGGETVWVSRTTVLVPARHKYGKEEAKGRKHSTLVEDAKADGCVAACGGNGAVWTTTKPPIHSFCCCCCCCC